LATTSTLYSQGIANLRLEADLSTSLPGEAPQRTTGREMAVDI
jgi:hypothetical protein